MTKSVRTGRHVAVLGAGLTGTLTALELAESGCEVELFEREAEYLTQASFVNEGKIHLGFVYAKDRPERTARTMIEGAVLFEPLLARWIDRRLIAKAASSPFIYALHRDSMISETKLLSHFRAVEALYTEVAKSKAGNYIGNGRDYVWRRTSERTHESLFDSRYVMSSFHTIERALDARVIAEALRAAVHASPRLQGRTEHEVASVRKHRDGRLSVLTGKGIRQELHGPYDAVVNALWESRAAIDATLGIAPIQPLMHRFKVGLHTARGHRPPGIESVTFVLGSFGDTVAFRERAYASWYPSGLLRQETNLAPASPRPGIDPRKTADIAGASLSGLARLLPAAERWAHDPNCHWQASGGYITAWGTSGIEDQKSQLHERYEVGVYSHGCYHSIDTGKYTLAPLFASEVCARVLDRPRETS